MQGYYVWAKLIEALADLGYDANNIVRVPVHPMIGKRVSFSALVWIDGLQTRHHFHIF